jgi:hypothetical protein
MLRPTQSSAAKFDRLNPKNVSECDGRHSAVRLIVLIFPKGRGRKMRILIGVACLASIALAAQAAISSSSPDAAVRAAYAADALALENNGAGAAGDPGARERLFSHSLLKAINAAEMSGLPADPFTDGSPHLVDLKIALASETRDAANVLADFARGDGARENLTYSLVLEHRQWRIDDIRYALLDGEGRTLRGIIAAH